MKRIKHTAFIIIVKIYLLLFIIFFLLRAFFYYYNQDGKHYFFDFKKLINSFLWGFRYDFIIVSYILTLPFLLLIVSDYTQKNIFKNWALYFSFVFLEVLLLIMSADIIYYNEFFTHLNSQVLNWFNNPDTIIHMIVEAPELSFMLIPFMLIMVVFYKLLKRIFKSKPIVFQSYISIFFTYLLIISLMVFASKGRIIGHGLKTADAYNDDNVFMNEFKINPVFTIIESYNDMDVSKNVDYTQPEIAIKNTKKYLGITTNKYTSPIARDIKNDSTPVKKNIVFIFMERKASWKMKYFGNRQKMTPFLDSLFLKSFSFDRFYSAGTRTFEGVYGSLYGFPILFSEHPLKGITIKKYYGLPHILKEKDYKTVFFCPHTPRFDNLLNFIPKNGFDRLFSQNDYPQDSLKNAWGVDDHFLFNFALKEMDKMYADKQTFFSVILTISDHNPYYVPDFIKGENIKLRAARFADWSLRDFFKKARNKKWFNNTVFVLVGDHGKPHNGIYPTELFSHHVPFMIYEKDITPQINHTIGDQKDIMPILFDYLHFNYTNNTFGINNTKRKKPHYAYFNHYEKNGILDEKYLLVINNKKKIVGLYDYVHQNKMNLMNQYPEIARKMANVLKSNLQTSYLIKKNNLQLKPKPLKP